MRLRKLRVQYLLDGRQRIGKGVISVMTEDMKCYGWGLGVAYSPQIEQEYNNKTKLSQIQLAP